MKLPFADGKGFERLPGDKVACSGYFKAYDIDRLLETKESKVLATAARFLQVPEAEIIQMIPYSKHAVTIIFAQKEHDLYEWDDEDE